MRAESGAQRALSAGRAPTLTNCPECNAVRFSGRPCPICNWRPTPKPTAVDIADGELGRVDRGGQAKRNLATAAEQLQFFRQLTWIARERGYASGWAAHKFREKFGRWPIWHTVAPEAPDDAVRSWVRSRQIAWAKAQRGAA